jgi:formylmethanofuran dehydrogenase subunit C
MRLLDNPMLSLTLIQSTTLPLECDDLAPDRLRGMSLDTIRSLPLRWGNRSTTIGEWFRVEGSPDDSQLRLEGELSTFKGIGTRMATGRIEVIGSVGMHLGAQMTGGEIVVQGDAHDWAGAEMRGGLIRIHGTAADHLGGAYAGSIRGMRGGTILVHGNAGHEVGSNLRRGLIAIAGTAGDFLGIAAIAGTIVVAGKIGNHPGAGMKRGSIFAFERVEKMPPSYRFDCEYEPTFWAILSRKLRRLDFPLPQLPASRFRRYSGDLLALGKGEILERVV